MNPHNDLPSHQIGEPRSLLRSPSTTDFLSLLHHPSPAFRRSKENRSVSISTTDESESRGSDNSQILYMAGASKQSRKSRASLSSIGNRSSCIMDGFLDIEPTMEEKFEPNEGAWNIIGREIFEWQHVCLTGRPYWWSPESKYSRLRKLPSRITREPLPRLGIREIDKQPKTDNSTKRRAISDSNLAGQECTKEMAYLVAIQLLGSCFTLPPDHDGMQLPDYTSYDQTGADNSPDPRLISALRMHTHFRYSPCFGHQARNTSPIQLWPGANDDPSPASSPPYEATDFNTPTIGSSGSHRRQHRSHRQSKVTEGSESVGLWESRRDDHVPSSAKHRLHSMLSAKVSYRRQSTDDEEARWSVVPQMLGLTTPKQRSEVAYKLHMDSDADILRSCHGTQSKSRPPRTNYRLQPVIRSEPHHVFVQPVKELVVRRWKTFRRRFGGSLNAPLPTGSEDDVSGAFTTPSGVTSPAMSSDGRARRRRAQERGDIHSNGVSDDSTLHYNSPASGCLSPNDNGNTGKFWADSVNSAPAFQLADPLTAAAALALAQIQTSPVKTSSSTITPHTALSQSSSSRQIQSSSFAGHDHQRPEVSGRIEPKSSPNPSCRRKPKLGHRKSMLSEMHTPEDFADDFGSSDSPGELGERSVFSVAGSILSNSGEDVEPDVKLVIRSRAQESIGSHGPINASYMRRMTIAVPQRNSRLVRTSSSGTQIFSPTSEGVEVDGLPTGPGQETWAWPRRERTYL